MARTKKDEDLFAELKEETVVEETKAEEKPVKPVKKVKVESKFSNNDMIACKSVTSGGLNFIGFSGTKYRFEGYGNIEYISYEDLRREAQSANPTNYLFYPRFVVEDPDFVEEFPKLEEFYSKFYEGDFEDIIDMPNEQMKEAIAKLPNGCKECVKGIVATKIDDGSLDSVAKIKALDGIFGTNMLLMLANN
jgi:hypothetical protein